MREHVRDALGELAAMLDVEVVAHVDELVCLLGDCLGNARIAVPDAHDANAREEVAVFVTLVIDEPLSRTRDELDRLAREGVHDVGVIELLRLVELLSHIDYSPLPMVWMDWSSLLAKLLTGASTKSGSIESS